MKYVGFLMLIILLASGIFVAGEEYDIEFVGTVRNVTDVLTVDVEEVMATAAENICDTVEVRGDVTGIEAGDTVHILGGYDADNCVVSVKAENHFIYMIPEGASLEKLPQSIQFTGEILRIYEMRGETFCDISVEDVVVVTYQEQTMCQAVTVKISPVAGEVEEGLEPGDEVEFSGTYDEKSCMVALGWHDDYLRRERRTGGSWLLIVAGFVVFLVLRKGW